jgi:mgtE-like transporter
VEKRVLYGNFLASFFLVIMVSFFLGLIAMLFTYLIMGIILWKIIWVSLIAALLANVIEIPSTYFTTLWLFKKGHDPNNIMGPFVSTTGDIVSILALLVAIVVVV